MIRSIFAALMAVLAISCGGGFKSLEATVDRNDILFNDIAKVWDEGMPMGNAFIGANLWQKGENMRMAIDRIDLWDLRPTDSLSGDNFSYKWVEQQWRNNTYQNVQQKLDVPYDKLPAPSKIPGAAIEFDISSLGKVVENRLHIKDALVEVKWDSGVRFTSFVHASEPVGWFVFEGVGESMKPQLLSPRYQAAEAVGKTDPVAGQDLRRLEYTMGEATDDGSVIRYHQKGWGDAYYDVAIKYEFRDGNLVGVWSITSSISDAKEGVIGDISSAEKNVMKAYDSSLASSYANHKQWWSDYYSRSVVTLDDPVIEKQYYNEIYKFGCSTRADSYIIPLQSVWTADNGLLPPWKGDVHHDLNTQLSYWPAYTGGYEDLGMSYLNTLWQQRETNRAYTKKYFGVDGINVPGVATLSGEPMGGWIQYALSPTVSAWLAQHFYLHWAYTMDEKFLLEMGYPYVKEVATYLEGVTSLNGSGERVLPISSSPEIHDNSRDAWFDTMSNYDLALIYGAFNIASEMAAAAGREDEAKHWLSLRDELPAFELDATGGLMFVKGQPYDYSHRHFSNAMAVMPLSIFDVTKDEKSRRVVEATLSNLDRVGPSAWCGYSYSWLGNMKARALDGEGAYEALKIFAECFILRNGFHANGDQSKSGKSGFLYRPFTLEGNFAYASGVQEMLLQSHTGVVRIFPAIPSSWKSLSFDRLKARGALTISAKMEAGIVSSATIECAKGGTFKVANPFDGQMKVVGADRVTPLEGNIYEIEVSAGCELKLTI